MIHYHGGPITPTSAAIQVWMGRHAFVSYAYQQQMAVAADVAQSFALDNGAFSVWKNGDTLDIEGYFRWVDEWHRHPGFDWCLIPDVIDGDEAANDELLARWPFPAAISVPVWHLHESFGRLGRLCERWPRVALGSSGAYATPGAPVWWQRIAQAMSVVCDSQGRPNCKLHGLRMLDPDIFRHIPFASADSTNVARNVGLDQRWYGPYVPPSSEQRALTMVDRIEAYQSPPVWHGAPIQEDLFA